MATISSKPLLSAGFFGFFNMVLPPLKKGPVKDWPLWGSEKI
jgi:hypothetical protein